MLIARRALKPLRAMALTAAQISGGDDLKKRMPDGGSDELAQLAGAFNGMMQRLDDAFEAERQFASDASHELRTPMAVIMAQCEDALSGEKTGADYREALFLVYFEGLSHAETAAVMGKREKQVADLIYRGKNALRKRLEQEGITDA